MKLKYKKMIFFITMWIMGVGMVTMSFRKPEKKGSVPANSGSVVADASNSPEDDATIVATNTPTPSPTVTPIPEDPTKLKECTDPAISDLIETFYTAMIDTDEETLQLITTDTSTIDIEKIAKKHEYIEAYDNIVCYTKPGVKDGDFVVYLTYDMKITTIETPAPSLDQCYVTKQDDTYYIQYNNFSDEINSLFKTYYASDDVQSLLLEVSENLGKAKEADSDLNDFINNLTNSIAKSSSSDKSTEADTEESNTESSKDSSKDTSKTTTKDSTKTTTKNK